MSPPRSDDDHDGSSPFHPGERAVQARVGVRDKIESIGRRMMRDAMPDQHRELFEELPFVLLGSLDGAGRPWASILVGPPGFVRSPDPRHLELRARAIDGDPAAANLAVGAPLGVLGIQLETRRRNRMNGTVVAVGPGTLTVAVAQSFGNCPQYIQARAPIGWDAAAPAPARRPESARLSEAAAALVRRADTFFVATASARPDSGERREGVDISHRGGKPGFVRAIDAGASADGDADAHTVLTWPDFRGNFMFNTLGNLEVNPRAGVLFVDFATGDLLSLTGEATVRWSGPEVAAFAGAQRLVDLRVTAGALLERAVPLRWTAAEPAPQLGGTGSWEG